MGVWIDGLLDVWIDGKNISAFALPINPLIQKSTNPKIQ